MPMKMFAAWFLAVFGGIVASAGSPWRILPCWGGGYVQGVAFCPSDSQRLYMYVDVGGPYRSDDAGKTWRPLHANMSVAMRERGFDEVRSLSVDPRNADVLVILAGSNGTIPGGFAVSCDGGETWKVTEDAFAYGNGPMRPSGCCLSRNPFNIDELVGGEDRSGIFLSCDNGESWMRTGPTNIWYTDIHYDVSVCGRVYACAPQILPAELARYWIVGESARTPRGFGFFRSDDGGRSWRRLSDESPTEVVQIETDGRLVGIFGNRSVKVSRNGGESWEPFEEGLYHTTELKLEPWTDGNYYALGAGKRFYLIGDGNGNLFRRGVADGTWLRIPHGRYFAGDPANEPRLAGKTPESVRMTALMTLVVDPKDCCHWFATDWFELWETLNAGETWTSRVHGVMQLCSFDFVFDQNSANNLCCCLWDMGAFVTTDGGVTFSRAQAAAGVTRQFPNNLGTALYLCGRPGIVMGVGSHGCDVGVWKSKDKGLTWTPTACRGLPRLIDGKRVASTLVEDSRDGSVLMTVSGVVGDGDGGVYRSRDEGESWSWEGDGLETSKGFDYGCNLSQGGWPRLVMSPDGSSVTVGRHGDWDLLTRGAGESKWIRNGLAKPDWRRFPIAADPHRPGRFLRGGESETLESTDGGVTWHAYGPLKGKACRCIAFDRHEPGLVAFGSLDAIFISSDGGASMRMLAEGLKVPSGRSRELRLDRRRLFLLTSGSGVWWRKLERTELGGLD